MSNEVRREMIAGEIMRIVSDIISNELKDPAVPKLTSIVSVDVTGDMSYAKLHISTLGTPEQLDAALEGLKRASGFVRSELGHRMTIRHVPQLIFVADRGIERSVAIQQTINKIHESQGGGNNAPKDS